MPSHPAGLGAFTFKICSESSFFTVSAQAKPPIDREKVKFLLVLSFVSVLGFQFVLTHHPGKSH